MKLVLKGFYSFKSMIEKENTHTHTRKKTTTQQARVYKERNNPSLKVWGGGFKWYKVSEIHAFSPLILCYHFPLVFKA